MGTELAALDSAEPTEDQLREACIRLAGKALKAADGDWEAAKDALRPVLQAVGAYPYETEHPRRMWNS